MKRNINYIVSCLLLVLFPLASVGVEVYHHTCNISKKQNSSLFVEQKCEKELRVSSCCAEEEPAEESCCADETPVCNDESETASIGDFSCCTNTLERIAIEDIFIFQDLTQIIDQDLSISYVNHSDNHKAIETEYSNLFKSLVKINDPPPRRIITYIHTINPSKTDLPSVC